MFLFVALQVDGSFLSPQVLSLYLQIPEDKETVFVTSEQVVPLSRT